MTATVLICDDEENLRRLLRASLGEEPYRIVEASNGDEALELARRLGPDVILLDMMMPGRSGLEVLREVRADPALAQTPVIMVTARTQASDRNAIAQAGADGYLAKPFLIPELRAKVEQLLAASEVPAPIRG